MGVTYTAAKDGSPGRWFVPETGFFAVNTQHPQFKEFSSEYKRHYVERDHSMMRRFYDNDVYGYVFEKLKAPTINTVSPYLNYGLEESIKEWTQQVFHPRLVIVDTLARVKQQFDRTNTAYYKYNNLLRNIQHLTGELSITIIFVSHLGKAQQEYSWDKIQGSTGMQGMTDFMWMLDRGDNSKTASLKGRGRDIEDFEFALKWNPDTWKYENEGSLWQVMLHENRKEIVDVMKHFAHFKKQLEVKPSEVSAHLGENGVKAKARIQKTMQRMVESRDLINGSVYGTYKIFTHLPAKEDLVSNENEVIN
jgi:RecA-family ATPase